MESSRASSPPSVILPTQTSPQFNQQVFGKRSHASAELDDFRGIPFGYIPARWKHSHVRTTLPSDTFYAVKNGPKCPQLSEPNNSEGGFNATIPFPSDVTESEFDCLNLFIIRPSREALSQRGYDPDIRLPVFTWVHGGAYGFGAGTDPMWDPSNLVLEALTLGKPFIAVNLNYRLGIFGFAATSAMIEAQHGDEVRGVNFGLRDQKVGFQWIANNISAFGGDPQRITIAGQSAGGNSTHVHALEAKLNPSTPLFRKAILQSGAVGCTGPISLADAEANWDKLCKVLAVSVDDKMREFETMLKITVLELLQASRELFWYLFPLVNDQLILDFTVDLDPVLVNLGETSNGKKLSGSAAPIDVLLGGVDNEGTPLYQRQVASVASFEGIQKQLSLSAVDPQVVNKMLDLYGVTSETSLDGLKSGLYRFLTEVQFGLPTFKAYEYFATNNHKGKGGACETTARRYKVNAGNPFSGGPGDNLHGIAHHCVDLIYIFNAFPGQIIQADRLLKPTDATNELLRQRMQKDWIDFIVNDIRQDIDLDTVVQYDGDRVTRIVKASEDKFFTQQSLRFTFLKKHMAETRSLVNAFAGITVC
ncbi:putative carboxylesterase [Halenospora varia]|nr:putative carboxylesterase [Halenospora varia]